MSDRFLSTNGRQRSVQIITLAVVFAGVVLGAALYTQLLMAESRADVLRSLSLERSLNDLFVSLQDAETGQRGYLLTGNERYLEPFKSSVKKSPDLYTEIEEQLSGRDSEDLLKKLYPLVVSKFNELQFTVDMKKQGKDSTALAMVNSNKGLYLMDSIRSVMAAISTSDDLQTDVRIARVQKIFDIEVILRVIAFGVLLALLYFVYLRLRPLMDQLATTLAEKDEEIAARRRAEAENRALIADLARKNDDLDSFAYLASHDLQEPLRTVSSFVSLLKEENADNLSEDSRLYMGFITESTERMRTLITGLLRYSQIGKGSERTMTNLNTLAETVRQNLLSAIEKSGAEVTIESLPTVSVFPLEFTQLLLNIVANAIKFVPENRQPVIRITARENDTHHEILVRDNGIGMTDGGKEKVFRMFARLNTKEEFAGYGIGLAFARKIIDLHGGEIRVESEPGTGSVFLISLPKATQL